MRALLSVALSLWVSAAAAQSLSELNAQALEAYLAQDLARAAELTDKALQAGPPADASRAPAYLEALNNHTFLRRTAGDPQALDAARAALDYADNTAQIATVQGYTALNNLAGLLSQTGDRNAARDIRDRMVQSARRGAFHEPALAAALPLAFENEDYAALRYLTEELIAVSGSIGTALDLDALYARQTALEEQGDIAGATALIHTRIAIMTNVLPDQAEQLAHTALWPTFFLNYQAENYGEAADGLRAWARTGALNAEEQAFIENQAEASLMAMQLGGFSGRADAQLGFAELTLAFAQIAYTAEDSRIGLALRELGYVQGLAGQYEQARETLQMALQTLNASRAASENVYLVLADLAANAWQRGAYDEAEQLYARADHVFANALKEGAAPMPDIDLGILFLNRARLALDMSKTADADSLLRAARMHIEAHLSSDKAKPHDARLQVQIDQMGAQITQAQGAPQKAIAQTLAAADMAQTRYPENHPALLRHWTNAADQLLVLGADDEGRALLGKALQGAMTALPDHDPLRTEIHFKLAVSALQQGERPVALDHLKKATQAHKSALYRAELPKAASTFEILSWGLLDQPNPDASILDAALDAVQWTQVSRSAQALALMEARLSANSPLDARLLKERQDISHQIARSRSALTAAYSAGAPAGPILNRQAALAADLKRTDMALAAAGLDLIGPAPIEPLTLDDIQSLLTSDEVLVTFVLPSLNPEHIAGLTGTSNIAIAIWKDGYRVGPVRETSRRGLRARVAQFRCEMAISDPGCDGLSSAGLRGAMLDDAPHEQAPVFDTSLAHHLYLDLFGGIETALGADKRLILVPPADLLNLPFAALISHAPDAPQPNWLIRRHALSVLPSLPALRTLRQDADTPRAPRRFLGVGDPDIGRSPDINCGTDMLSALRSAPALPGDVHDVRWVDGLRLAEPAALRQLARLPDATCELRAIETVAGPENSMVLTQADATEARVKSLSEAGTLAAQDILVFATHGLVAGEASAVTPGLVLTPPQSASARDDGLLSAAEIALLDLNARLVILSACNTAASDEGSSEGLSGLASSFLHAGARNLMVTHWAVFSAASAEISASVAQQLLTDEALSPADALRNSVLGIFADTARAARTKHPSYWAAFAIIGA